jgi:hybrid cluster-associated redox disulfide protein
MKGGLIMIHKDMSLFDIIQSYPKTRDVFIKYNMGCAKCMAAAAENLEEAAQMHGIDLALLLKDLNAVVD